MPRVQPQRYPQAARSPTPEPSRRTTSTNVINNILMKLEKAANKLPIPDLKAAVEGVLEIIKVAVRPKQNTNDLFELCIHLRRLENTVVTPLLNQQLGFSSALQARLDRLTSELTQLARDWQKLKAPHNTIFGFVNCDYRAGITDVNARMKSMVDAFEYIGQSGITVLESAIERIERPFLSKAIQKLPYTTANFNSISRNNAPVCFEGTRVAVLADIIGWIVSNGHQIYILNGIAGVGKTTIAQTISTLAAKGSCLSASFFFSKNEAGRNSSCVFFPTLAFQLAQFSQEFEVQLNKALMRWPDAPSRTPREQLNKMIVEPFQGVSVMHGRPILIVLDALDECGAIEGAELLRLLVDTMPQLPANFKLFITMRPEPQFLPILDVSIGCKQVILHDVEKVIVQEDIRQYLLHQLSQTEVQKVIYGCSWQIGTVDLEALVQEADRLFVVASTAEKFIKDTVQCDPQHQLDILLGGDKLDEYDLPPHAALDRMYMQILEAAVPASRSSSNIVHRFQNVIGSVIILQHPLPLPSIAKLLETNLPACEAALQHLRSVIVLDNHDRSPRVYHRSFPDFITDRNRCRDERFLIKSPEQHARLFVLCLNTMDRLLRQNMCRLPIPDRYMKNTEIPGLDAKIQEYIPAELEYACTYWAVHLSKAAFSSEAVMKLEMLALKHLLPWLEVLSFIGGLEHAYSALVHAQKFLMANHAAVEPLEMMIDAQRFILGSYEIVKVSAMQIYYSALPFAPMDSSLFWMYEYGASESIEVLWGREKTRNPALAVLAGHSDGVNSVTFSLNGTRVASASSDKTVRLWDGITGAVVAELRGHSDPVNSVVFSPDGSRLASASYDKTVRLWDGVTGATVAVLTGHDGGVNSVMFSPDGLRLASASSDKTAQLWDGVTGAVIAELRGHSGSVTSVAFSFDGSRLASSSSDKTVRLWDVVTGGVVAEFQGHSGCVYSVVFSPDGSRLASASRDKTIRLWNVVTESVAAELRGHADSVYSVVFSPDGSLLASASSDKTVRLWDGVTGGAVAELQGHSDWVYSVVFSPDGSRLASASRDMTVRLWDGVTRAFVTQYKSNNISHAFPIYGRIGAPHRLTSEGPSIIPGRKADKSTALLSPGQQIYSVLLEFDQDTSCYVLTGLWTKADQTLSKVCLCWLPPGSGWGRVVQVGAYIMLGLLDGKVFIFSTARLKVT